MMSKSRIPSPARSQGAPVTPRRSKPRRTLSMTSAKSDASGGLTSVVEQYIKDDKFKMSPLRRKSVLPDDTDIDVPRRASWWKRLDGSSRDVLEALDTNRMPDELLLEDYEFEVQKDKQNQSVPESSDNESVASIIVPQRRLFNQKSQPQGKFGEIMASRKSLGKTTLEDQDKTIHTVPKNLFKQGQPRNRPAFPAALLNSTNKTINKTVDPEPETNKQGRNLFGQAGTKRKKNMFTDFVLSESEDDSEVQHKVFGFKKSDKRASLATRNRRMPSLTPSVTTDIDIDDWNLLPSSTMIGNGSIAMEGSRVITDKDIELAQVENQEVKLTEPNESLELESNTQNTSKIKQSLRRSTLSRSKKQSDVYYETSDIVSETKTVEQTQDDDQDVDLTEASETLKPESFTSENPKRQTLNRTRLSESRKLSDKYNKTFGNEKVLESITTEQAPSRKMNITLPESNDSVKSDSARHNSSENPKRQTLTQLRLNKSTKQSEENNKTLDSKSNYESESTEQAPSVERDVTLPEGNVSRKSESVRRNTRENSKRQTLNRPGLSKSNKTSDDSNKTNDNKNVLEAETTEYAQADNRERDVCLTERNESFKPEPNKQNDSEILKKLSLNRTGPNNSKKISEVNKTFLDENNVEPVAFERTRDDNRHESNKSSKPETDKHDTSRSLMKQSLDRTSNSKSRKLSSEYNKTLADNKTLHGNIPKDADDDYQDVNEQTTVCEPSVEDQMAELHSENRNNNKSEQETEQSVYQRSKISAKETSKEDPNEDMEEMVWDEDEENKNDTSEEESEQEDEEEVENEQDNDEAVEIDQEDEDVVNDQDNDEGVEINQDYDEQEVSDQVTPTKDVPNKSQKIVESSVEEEQIDQENEAVDETPNATYDTTGRNRIKDVTQMKSPESVLKNISRDNMSFKPIGRSTSFRKSRSPTENIISRPTLIPIQESIIGSDGSRNSSTEGSGWDSHRTTRKTLRQTFGKDFTPRKSLRTLVMEKSAKRQTDVSKNTSKIDKTRYKTVLEEAGKKTTKVNDTTNKTVLEDIRDRRVSNRNLSRDQLLSPKSPAPGVSTHHVSDPNISKPQISYHKSVHEINELGTSPQISDRLELGQAIDDSGPEISIHASYGHGMSEDASDQDDDHSSVKNPQTPSEQRKSVKKSMPLETDHDMQEALDYDPSLQEETTHEQSSKEISEQEKSDHQASASETEAQDVSDHGEEMEHSEIEESVQNVEADDSNQESEPEVEIEESEHEESQKLSEPDSEHEDSEEERETEQEDQEQSQQELEPESEREDLEDSQQEIDPESDPDHNEDSQPEIYPESEREEREYSQQEPEPESEDEEQDDSQQQIEEVSEREASHESVYDNSQQQSDQESDKEIDTENEQNDGESDDDHADADGVETEQNHKRFTERVVFDNEISDQEIDYDLSERVSRQMTDNDISEQVSDVEMEEQSRRSIHDNHNVSVGTKKSVLLMQMQKIAQENMELRQKIKEKVEKSLKRKRDCNPLMSPMQPKIFSSMRRTNKPEPKKPKIQPRKTTTITIGTLPKEFVDDLKYKPPKRFQPANAPWITKRLYKFLETKLEPKYDYRARIRAEELVQSLYGFTKQARRRAVAAPGAVDALKREMARLNVVNTHFDFYEFFHEFMPREIRIKVNPDIVNKIPMPKNGIFADILPSRPVVDV